MAPFHPVMSQLGLKQICKIYLLDQFLHQLSYFVHIFFYFIYCSNYHSNLFISETHTNLHLRRRPLIRPYWSFGLILEPINCVDGLCFMINIIIVYQLFVSNLFSLLFVMVLKYIKIK